MDCQLIETASEMRKFNISEKNSVLSLNTLIFFFCKYCINF